MEKDKAKRAAYMKAWREAKEEKRKTYDKVWAAQKLDEIVINHYGRRKNAHRKKLTASRKQK
jgi:hypothetical protein